MPAIDQETNLEILKDDIFEETSAVFTTGTVIDENGDLITSLTTLTMSIFDFRTKNKLVTSRDVVSGFNSTTSKITVSLTKDDNLLIDHRHTIEKHILIFEFTYDGGASTGRQAYVFRVINVQGVGKGL